MCWSNLFFWWNAHCIENIMSHLCCLTPPPPLPSPSPNKCNLASMCTRSLLKQQIYCGSNKKGDGQRGLAHLMIRCWVSSLNLFYFSGVGYPRCGPQSRPSSILENMRFAVGVKCLVDGMSIHASHVCHMGLHAGLYACLEKHMFGTHMSIHVVYTHDCIKCLYTCLHACQYTCQTHAPT